MENLPAGHHNGAAVANSCNSEHSEDRQITNYSPGSELDYCTARTHITQSSVKRLHENDGEPVQSLKRFRSAAFESEDQDFHTPMGSEENSGSTSIEHLDLEHALALLDQPSFSINGSQMEADVDKMNHNDTDIEANVDSQNAEDHQDDDDCAGGCSWAVCAFMSCVTGIYQHPRIDENVTESSDDALAIPQGTLNSNPLWNSQSVPVRQETKLRRLGNGGQVADAKKRHKKKRKKTAAQIMAKNNRGLSAEQKQAVVKNKEQHGLEFPAARSKRVKRRRNRKQQKQKIEEKDGDCDETIDPQHVQISACDATENAPNVSHQAGQNPAQAELREVFPEKGLGASPATPVPETGNRRPPNYDNLESWLASRGEIPIGDVLRLFMFFEKKTN